MFDENEMPSTLSCNFIGLRLTGTALIQAWGGGEGFIKMNPEKIEWSLDKLRHCTEDEFKAELKKHVNDGGFGCEKILAANIEIIALYSNGASLWYDNYYLGIEKPMTEEIVEKFEEYFNQEC